MIVIRGNFYNLNPNVILSKYVHSRGSQVVLIREEYHNLSPTVFFRKLLRSSSR